MISNINMVLVCLPFVRAVGEIAKVCESFGTTKPTHSLSIKKWVKEGVAPEWRVDKPRWKRIGKGSKLGKVYYTPTQELGQGGSARVHPCYVKDEEGDFVCFGALKKFELAGEAMVKNELKMAQTLVDLDNVVQLLAITEGDHMVYELRGKNLLQAISAATVDKGKDAELTYEFALLVLYEVIRPIKRIHGKGVAYLDLKAKNLLLEREGQKENGDFLSVADFGHAGVATDIEDRVYGTYAPWWKTKRQKWSRDIGAAHKWYAGDVDNALLLASSLLLKNLGQDPPGRFFTLQERKLKPEDGVCTFEDYEDLRSKNIDNHFMVAYTELCTKIMKSIYADVPNEPIEYDDFLTWIGEAIVEVVKRNDSGNLDDGSQNTSWEDFKKNKFASWAQKVWEQLFGALSPQEGESPPESSLREIKPHT